MSFVDSSLVYIMDSSHELHIETESVGDPHGLHWRPCFVLYDYHVNHNLPFALRYNQKVASSNSLSEMAFLMAPFGALVELIVPKINGYELHVKKLREFVRAPNAMRLI